MADWAKLEELFHAALGQPPENRAEFLQQACPDDEQLRKEVQSLLDRAGPDGFLEGSPLSSIQPAPACLKPGQMVGRLRIVELIGAGGMGEVYRATDERLKRDVAVKVLRSAFAPDRERMRRFEEEARAAGMLNHPNIVAIYDVGVDDGIPYVVSELLAGETLRTRLADGPLPLRKTLAYAGQIARGLAAAHQKGIVHRDLKPENVFVVGSDSTGGPGQVKILDFGLAKLVRTDAHDHGTVTMGTQPGVAMGTVGYMSPEQLRGGEVDHRTDIFAFGVVLFEMLAGRRAFLGQTSADVIGATLREDPPDLLEIDPKLPEALARLVEHCLEKQPEDRFESARDLAFALETIASPSSSRRSVATSETPSPVKRRLPLAVSIMLAAVAILGIGYLILRPSSRDSPQPSFERVTYRKGLVPTARFVPSGSDIVYAAAWDGAPLDVFSGRPGQPDARSFGLSGAQLLSVSSKGEMALMLRARWLYMFQFVGTLVRASLSGGAPRELMENVVGADWSPDGSQMAVVRVSDAGQRLEFPPGKLLYETPGWIEGPRVSPRGEHVAFIVHPTGGNADGSLWVVDLEGHATKLSPDYYNIRGLAWFRTGEIWYGASLRRDEEAVWASTVLGKQRVLWRAPGPFTVHDVAADGRVLLSNERIRYESFGLPSGAKVERNLSWADIDNPTDISDDGSMVLLNVEINDMQVYLRKMDGSPAVPLGKGFPIALSHDMKRVLIFPTFQRSNRIGVLPTGPGEPSWHEAAVEFLPRGGSWLLDNRRVLLIGREKGHQARSYVFDTENGASTPVTPEGIIGTLVSPDGKWLLAGPVAHRARYPLEGGDAMPVAPLGAGRLIRWSVDPDSIYMSEGTLPAHVYRASLKTGAKELVYNLLPSDPAGILRIDWVVITPDGRAYAYAFFRMQHDLMVVSGLR
ncbi:MAG TPA: protein kinase [Bryobacteraceae bacterium]|nr:protein kinase [Bryobacteraceae bacterium]